MEFLETGAGRSPTPGSGRCGGPLRHFTHSKVMAWVAFDRAVKAVEQFGYDGGDVGELEVGPRRDPR